MAKLTDVGRLLIRFLKNRNATEDQIVGIMMLLQTPQEQWDLVKWIADNPSKTVREIMKRSLDTRAKKI